MGGYRFRWLELALLIVAGLITCTGFAYLSYVEHHRVLQHDMIYPLVFVGSTLALSLWVGRFAGGADEVVLPIAALVSGVGILIITRLDGGLGHKQLVWTLLGEAAVALLMVAPSRLNT